MIILPPSEAERIAPVAEIDCQIDFILLRNIGAWSLANFN